MSRWFSRFVPAPAFVLVFTLAVAAAVSPLRAAPPQEKPPSAEPRPAALAPPLSEPDDDPWEERKARAREDVEYLEILHKAKQAECREAELRNRYAQAFKSDLDRQKQKGYSSTYTMHQAEMSVAENQSQLEMRRVELKDIEIRLARAQRRLKAVERTAAMPEPASEAFQAVDRLHELELKYERLRREFELVKRQVDLQKSRP